MNDPIKNAFEKIKKEMKDLQNQIDELKNNKPKETLKGIVPCSHKFKIISKEKGKANSLLSLFGIKTNRELKVITSQCKQCGIIHEDRILTPTKELKQPRKNIERISEVKSIDDNAIAQLNAKVDQIIKFAIQEREQEQSQPTIQPIVQEIKQ